MTREYMIDEDGFYPTHTIQFWDEATRTQYRVLQHGDDDDVMIHIEVYVRHSLTPLEDYKCESGGYMPPHAGDMGMWQQIIDDYSERRLTAEQACAMVDDYLNKKEQ